MRELYIGLISGTSMDAVDAALVAFDPPQRPQILAVYSAPLSQSLIALLRDIGPQTSLEQFARADAVVADAFADAVGELLTANGYRGEQIQAIGSHGQTVWHATYGCPPLTVQIGDPNRLAERTGITVVADFRRRDVAAGGQGAPLACSLHTEIFHRPGMDTIVLNLGGIANLTLLPGDSAAADITGFDCGPANTLLDAWCRRHRNCSFDTDGIWAAGGILQHTLLERLTSDDFFQCPPPKSTGPEYFNLDWLMRRGGNLLARTSPNDVQTTLAELTAITVARAIRESPLGSGEVLVCGGGVHNRHLLVRLSAHLPEYRIRSTAELGVDPDFVEATAFAWLARCRLYNVAGNIPAVTGARRRVVLGGIYAGNSHVE